LRKLITVLSSMALHLSIAGIALAAQPATKGNDHARGDNFPGKLARKQIGLRQQGLDMVLKGQAKATGANQVVEVGKGQFVELAQTGEDQILTFLGEFGPLQANDHPGHPAHLGDPGPLHNAIPAPDRSVDNTTIWTDDFNRAHYESILYDKAANPSMANWYLEQSSGRYSVDGYVSDWVEVPYNEAAYGSNYCGSIVCTRDIGRFLVDQSTAWYAAQVTEGMSAAQIDALLAPFDVWDRYDYDGDGNFNEPDGYIDHFQSVHAGEGEETGGGAQGTDAIWSHRSYANPPAGQGPGPTVTDDDGNPVVVPFGGIHIGGSSKWIGDYTIEPENGGVGVFSHEFGHDLGLPDEYDTNGNVGNAENSTAWWTPWSQGSYGSVNGIDLGSAPVDATAWEKLVLGWSNYEVAFAGESSSHKLSASEINTKQAQSLVVVLPDKEVSKDVGDPYAGSWFYHSGSGNDLDNTMTRPITLGATPGNLSFKGKWQIETCWDYAWVQVSTDGGATFTNLATSASTNDDENGQNFGGNGITGVSGAPKVCDDLSATPAWVDVTADLTPYANQTIQLRFEYFTDGAVVGDGLSVDDLTVDGVTDGAETDPGWDYDGFVRTTGIITSSFANYYIAEYRTYRGYDLALKLGPYQFTDPAGNWVEHFPYQDGMLIWYYDTSQPDNNVTEHPGEGLILPIDAHPDIRHWSNGTNGRPRLQSYDSTFGLDKTDAITVHSIVTGTFSVPSMAAARTFNDDLSYYRATDPADAISAYKAAWSSVNNPHTGTVIKVASVSSMGTFMQVLVNP
jgi:immune inhibitor A